MNLRHHFFCAQAVVPAMKAKGGGAIINLGSISWHLGIKELAIYQTAKAAIEGLTRALAREYGEDNIRVTCVVPGNVRTPRQLKWYTPEGEAEIVAGQALKGRLIPEDIAAMVAVPRLGRCPAHHRPRIFRGRGLALMTGAPVSVCEFTRRSARGPSG